jgi:hypothetical protein
MASIKYLQHPNKIANLLVSKKKEIEIMTPRVDFQFLAI